jgi:enoyl-CoA hydratase/carnithine racemase
MPVMNIQAAHTAQADAVLLRENDGPVAILTLNRPAARNSLSEALLGELTAALNSIADDTSVRAVVLAANGTAFCAGHDLKELTGRRSDTDGGRAYFQHIMTTCSTMMQRIVTLPQPVIAAVQGAASAAGCQLVASCDLAVAAATASFTTPGVDIGLFCSTPMVALSRNVPRKHAMAMLLTGEAAAADKALAIGLVNELTPPGRERGRAIELAKQIASKSSHVVGIGKAAFYRQIELPLGEAYAYASKVMTENMMARDAEEGICAFIEKRDPAWEDR